MPVRDQGTSVFTFCTLTYGLSGRIFNVDRDLTIHSKSLAPSRFPLLVTIPLPWFSVLRPCRYGRLRREVRPAAREAVRVPNLFVSSARADADAVWTSVLLCLYSQSSPVSVIRRLVYVYAEAHVQISVQYRCRVDQWWWNTLCRTTTVDRCMCVRFLLESCNHILSHVWMYSIWSLGCTCSTAEVQIHVETPV